MLLLAITFALSVVTLSLAAVPFMDLARLEATQSEYKYINCFAVNQLCMVENFHSLNN